MSYGKSHVFLEIMITLLIIGVLEAQRRLTTSLPKIDFRTVESKHDDVDENIVDIEILMAQLDKTTAALNVTCRLSTTSVDYIIMGGIIMVHEGEFYTLGDIVGPFNENEPFLTKISCPVVDDRWLYPGSKVEALVVVYVKSPKPTLYEVTKAIEVEIKAPTINPCQWVDGGEVDGLLSVMEYKDRNNAKVNINCDHTLGGNNPSAAELSSHLGSDVLRAICWKESRWRQFDTNGQTLINRNANGTTDYGCMQVNNATRTEAWHWPSNVSRGKGILKEKERHARCYLNKHRPYSKDMLLNETIQRYNGGVYYSWNRNEEKWFVSPANNYVERVRNYMREKPWPH